MTISVKNESWVVPAYEEAVYFGKNARYVVVIPVINEGDRIRNQLRETAALDFSEPIDIVVADGGSTDGSLEPSFLKDVGVRCLLLKTGPGKLSAQLRCAYSWCLEEGYEGIITIDGNGKDGVEHIEAFIKSLSSGYDYVQASRFIKGGVSSNTPLSRLLAIRFIHAPIQSLSAGFWFTDTTQGFRAYSSRYLLDERVQTFREVFDTYELLAYLTARASQLSFRVKEIPTSRHYPPNEAAPTKISGITALAQLVLIVLCVLFRVYHPPYKPGSE